MNRRPTLKRLLLRSSPPSVAERVGGAFPVQLQKLFGEKSDDSLIPGKRAAWHAGPGGHGFEVRLQCYKRYSLAPLDGETRGPVGRATENAPGFLVWPKRAEVPSRREVPSTEFGSRLQAQ